MLCCNEQGDRQRSVNSEWRRSIYALVIPESAATSSVSRLEGPGWGTHIYTELSDWTTWVITVVTPFGKFHVRPGLVPYSIDSVLDWAGFSYKSKHVDGEYIFLIEWDFHPEYPRSSDARRRPSIDIINWLLNLKIIYKCVLYSLLCRRTERYFYIR